MEAPTDMNAFIGKGSEFVGKLTFEGTVRIDGKVEGEIFSKGTLVIGEGAQIKAKVNVDTVIISGTITGNVVAKKLIEMRSPGHLYGNIRTPALQIEKGVTFEGSCKMENFDKLEESEPARDKNIKMFPEEPIMKPKGDADGE
ncbi:MAG: polymer-forming cytoskeletal protein [Candidatus Alcyoniella australis]|nr:polymer-forming cytoskeletal protein [Candidatus Alcyoniella australis]